ncbi:MAG TPA: bifunctional sulfate adenylyltransferase/adenylylsulfate kinase [Paracoccus solventivorans]|uniref:Adenylyl-sulfate kinase n=1 Tax=Paracoccus solventivorans TaxID=53463 RepID=A0A832PMS0_9RHOB|nr:bifunctional sulfate adenylyltransferase/adenylylsulfate kinase [Paracoccus solventivorans]HHW33860.1 bifunctional sulfate adenylyltransferase/adenylylsulfate kinase [Paracoccus solventivorans]HMM08180.1 bifunctional sulfate adenylyltransferase/adenylylsulfate kinase [Paracoccus solventivorans]
MSQPNLVPIPELYVNADSAQKLKADAGEMPSWDLTQRQLCDLELLMNGGFHPLKGFLTEADYDGVVNDMRLSSGALWPMPITLDVSEEFAAKAEPGTDIALRDPEGVILAILSVTDRWTPDKKREAEKVFGNGADDIAHPAINYLHNVAGPVYLGGPITGIQPPTHYDFKARRDTPNELRAFFRKMGWRRIVAFQTRNPLHRAHQELTFRAAREAQANLLIHPVVGMTKPGDVDHFTRVRCYEAVLDKYPSATTHLSLLNLAMRMAGPREAVWHGIIRRNHGLTHMIVGRDHAGPGKNSQGQDFYGPYDAQELFRKHQADIGVEMVDFKQMVYVQERAQYEPRDEVEEGATILDISGTELRRRLREGLEIPEWFSFPEVVTQLRRTSPPRDRQGFTVFFTGLSGSGKSTIANALMVKLMELGGRPVTLLDGDVVRKHLSSELGFSKEHRDINIKRIGYVASEITKNGGIALCAPIAPYAATRRAVRQMIEQYGAFLEVHVATSLEECERRDRKGLYKLAREGKIKEFTGISDPYEVPENPELRVQTEGVDVDYAAQQVLLKLESMGLIGLA